MKKQSKKTVLHVSSVHYVFDTRIFVKECHSLADAGYNVHLIAQHDREEVKNGIAIDPLPIVNKKSERFTRVIPALIKKVTRYPKGSIVHFHDPELILMGFYLKFKGYKIIYDIHEHTPTDFYTKEWLPGWIRPFMYLVIYLLEFLAGKFFDGIITVVPPNTKRFQKSYNVEISNYPILDETYQKVLSEDIPEKKAAIYIGDFTYRRGIDKMVRAMGLLKEEDVKLKLGGRFSPEKIRADIESLDGWQKCEFLGWLGMEDIWRNLCKSKVGIVTLQDVPSHRLLLPVKMFEYMAAGLPVIASDFKMFREIIKKHECGILVDPDSPEEIAEAIRWVFKNPNKAKEMGMRGKKAVLKQYNWKTEERELLEFYESL